MTVFTVLCLSTHRGTAWTIPRTSRQQEPSQTWWERLALNVGQKVADVEGRGILVYSLLEERDGTVGVEHSQSVPLAGTEFCVGQDCLVVRVIHSKSRGIACTSSLDAIKTQIKEIETPIKGLRVP